MKYCVPQIMNMLNYKNGWMGIKMMYLGEFESMRWRICSYPSRGPPLIEYPPKLHYIPSNLGHLVLKIVVPFNDQKHKQRHEYLHCNDDIDHHHHSESCYPLLFLHRIS